MSLSARFSALKQKEEGDRKQTQREEEEVEEEPKTDGTPHFIAQREARNVGLDLKALFAPPGCSTVNRFFNPAAGMHG